MRLSFPVLTALITACHQPSQPQESPVLSAGPAKVDFNEDLLVFFEALPEQTLPAAGTAAAAQIALGRRLYFEKRLSKNHDISCNSCHKLDRFGVDNEKTSPGHKGQRGDRNSPTVYNARFYVAQFWDGRAADLTEQAKGPILNPIEMAMTSEQQVEKVLASIPGYVDLFKRAYPQDKKPLSYQNMAAAIAAFEAQLLTPSRFDKFLEGDRKALTDEEIAGLVRFANLGCTTCHNGPAIGGSSFQRIGQVIPYEDNEDLGRFEVSQKTPDKQVFKVPSLRNIAKTGPYFHNGRFGTLLEAVNTMAKHQLGKKLSNEDAHEVIAFLHSLTGEAPKDYITKPEPFPSGPKTPKPDPT